MAETERSVISRPDFNSEGCFQCFGFGYNGFTQFAVHKSVSEGGQVQVAPLDLPGKSLLAPSPLNVGCVSSIAASWSSTFYVKGRF